MGLGTVCTGVRSRRESLQKSLDIPSNELILANLPLGHPIKWDRYWLTVDEHPESSTLPKITHSTTFLLDALRNINVNIKIDKSQYTEGADAISIMPEVNSVESYKLGKAIREIIKMTHKHLGDKSYNFIEEFKNKLGDKYLSEIEKIGVNLHFLELKFT